MAVQLGTFDKIYTYTIQSDDVLNDLKSDIIFDEKSKIISFNSNDRIVERLNGVGIASYTGNEEIVNFLKSKNARVIGHNDWEIGNIDINENRSDFLKDERVVIGYSFFVENIENGRKVKTMITIQQYVNVSYYSCEVSQSISSIGRPLLLWKSYRDITNDDFTIDLKYHSNTDNGHSVSDVGYFSNIHKTRFTVADTDLTSSPYRNYIELTPFGSSNVKLRYYFDVFYEKSREYAEARFVGTDTNRYFKGKDNIFRVPTYQIELTYSDSTTQTLDLDEFDIKYYCYVKNTFKRELTPDTSIIDEPTTVTAVIENGVQLKNKLTFDIEFEDVTVESAELVGFNSITLGACLEDYENIFELKINYNDGSYITYNKYRFDEQIRKETILTSDFLPSKLKVSIELDVVENVGEILNRERVYEIDAPTTFNLPYIDRVKKPNVLLLKDVSKFSLPKLTFFYQVIINSEKTKSYSYYAKLEVSDLTTTDFDEDELSGNKIIDNSVGEYVIAVSTKNPFDETKTINSEINVEVKDYNNISSWDIKNPKQKYEIGEKFLENDDTLVSLTFNGKVYEAELSRLVGSGAFSISPQANYEFEYLVENKEVLVKANFGGKEQKTYTINVGKRNTSSSINTVTLKLVYLEEGAYVNYNVTRKQKPVWLLVDSRVLKSDGTLADDYKTDEIYNSVTIYNEITSYKWYVYGYVENIGDKDKNGRVVLLKDIENPRAVSAGNNMVVKFPCYVEGNADKINKSTFGIMFGADNYNNRLFVSGNSDYQNRDWHTSDISSAFNEEYDNESINNLTYFPDINEQQYGSSDTKVVGYSIVSDNKMLVLKEKSDKETTVYFRTPTYNEDDYGNIYEVFTVSKGNNSVAGISPHSIIDFNGDTLFIDSDNTLQGLDLVGIQGDTQRYANSRSKLIDNKLKHYDLSNSILWSNQKYLYLTVDGLGTFITHYETKGDSQYEWWLVDYAEPQAFIEIDGVTYYGNNKGEFFKINKNSFVDIYKVFINKAEGTYDTNINPSFKSDNISVSEEIINKIHEGDYFKHYASEDFKENIYKRVGTIGKGSDYSLNIDNEGNININPIKFIDGDGKEAYKYPIKVNETYYLNMLSGTTGSVELDWIGHNFGEEFYFKYKDGSTKEVELYSRENNEKQDVSTLNSADICVLVSNEIVETIDKTNKTFKFTNYKDIVSYGGQGTQIDLIRGEISHVENVKAYYITSPLLANIQYTKTLWDFTLTNDSGLPSELKLGVARNKMPKNIDRNNQFVSYSATDFDYDEVDYNTLTFESIEIPRVFTRHKVMPKLKFVCFALMNENDTNCVLTSMAITYTIPFPQV